MAKQIGERFDLSEDAFITLYYDGDAVLMKNGEGGYLNRHEVKALREALAQTEGTWPQDGEK